MLTAEQTGSAPQFREETVDDELPLEQFFEPQIVEQRVLFAVAYRGKDMWMMWWVAAAYFVVAASLFFCACYPVPISLVSGADTDVHTWVDVELRAVRIERRCTIGVRSRSRLFFPGLVFLKVEWAAFGVWCWVIWPEPRCWDSRNNLEWRVSLRMLWSWCTWGILCPSFGAWSILCRAAMWPRSVAKLCERGCLFTRKKGIVLEDKKDQRQKPRHRGSGSRRGRSGGDRDSGWRGRRGSTRKCSSSSSSNSSPSRRKRRGKQQRVKEAQKLLEKYDPQCQQWKEEAKKKERAVELQEQAEVLAKVMKEQFDQTIRGVSKDEFVQIPGEQYGDRRFVEALGEFITRHGGGVAIPRAQEARSGLVFDTARKQ